MIGMHIALLKTKWKRKNVTIAGKRATWQEIAQHHDSSRGALRKNANSPKKQSYSVAFNKTGWFPPMERYGFYSA